MAESRKPDTINDTPEPSRLAVLSACGCGSGCSCGCQSGGGCKCGGGC
ncbi:hypothetical protein JNUCC64_14810 [Streptomyces sp. JNUCC 64]